MFKKKAIGFVLILLLLSLLSGCLFSMPLDRMGKIKGDYTYDFRAGKNASKWRETVNTDAVFDKDRFVELYNEDAKYDPSYYKHHPKKLDLKINAKEQPEEFEKIAASEVCFTVHIDNVSRSVSIYRYDSKLYFFIMSMGGRSKPGEEGYYYQEVPAKMAEYWLPIYEKVLADKEADHKKEYGDFTTEKTYSYDNEYFAECKTSSTGVLTIWITNKQDIAVCSFKPCRSNDFWGICWDKDSYDLWIQSGDVGYLCYSKSGDTWDWVKKDGAVKPDYIKGRYD